MVAAGAFCTKISPGLPCSKAYKTKSTASSNVIMKRVMAGSVRGRAMLAAVVLLLSAPFVEGAAGAATGGAGAAGQAAGGAAWTQSPTGLNVLAAEGNAMVQPTGLLSKFTSSPYFAPAVVQAGGAVLQGIGQAKAAQAQIDATQKLKDDELKRYNTNVGTRLWGNAPTGG